MIFKMLLGLKNFTIIATYFQVLYALLLFSTGIFVDFSDCAEDDDGTKQKCGEFKCGKIRKELYDTNKNFISADRNATCEDNTTLTGNLCDGIMNCLDGSDEKPEMCRALCKYDCRPWKSCISSREYCFENKTCPDDKLPPFSEFECLLRKKEAVAELHFDSKIFCVHKCGEACIPESWVCDGEYDCQYGEDEWQYCDCNDRKFFACGEYTVTEGSGDEAIIMERCIPPHVVCDGKNDCVNGMDETEAACRITYPIPIHISRKPKKEKTTEKAKLTPKPTKKVTKTTEKYYTNIAPILGAVESPAEKEPPKTSNRDNPIMIVAIVGSVSMVGLGMFLLTAGMKGALPLSSAMTSVPKPAPPLSQPVAAGETAL